MSKIRGKTLNYTTISTQNLLFQKNLKHIEISFKLLDHYFLPKNKVGPVYFLENFYISF